MKKIYTLLLLLCALPTLAQNDFYNDNDTLSLNSHVKINDIPVRGKVIELLERATPDSVKHKTNECGSIFGFNCDGEDFHITHMLYIGGVQFESQGIDYELSQIEIKNNTFSFPRKGKEIVLTENTTEKVFFETFPHAIKQTHLYT